MNIDSNTCENRIQDDRVDYLKALACVLVVSCHVLVSRIDAGCANGLMKATNIIISAIHVPLFFVLAGWLNHNQPILPYYKKKAFRILLPFVTFSCLKILYSVFVSSRYAHGDTLMVQMVDAFVFGRLYWFAYAIFVVLAVAPLFWGLSTRVLMVVFFASVFVSVLSDSLTLVLQIRGAAALMPFFLAGMIFKRISCDGSPELFSSRVFKYGTFIFSGYIGLTYVTSLFNESSPENPGRFLSMVCSFSLIILISWVMSYFPQGISWLSFVGRNAWPIMFLDSFFKAVLVSIMPVSSPTILIILGDIVLCVLICRMLMKVPGGLLLGISSR